MCVCVCWRLHASLGFTSMIVFWWLQDKMKHTIILIFWGPLNLIKVDPWTIHGV